MSSREEFVKLIAFEIDLHELIWILKKNRIMDNSDGRNDMNKGGYEDLAWVYGISIRNGAGLDFKTPWYWRIFW